MISSSAPPSVSERPPGYTSSRVHTNCPSCTCPTPPPVYSSPEDADHEWVSTAYKYDLQPPVLNVADPFDGRQIRIRFLDYVFTSDHQCTELNFPLDGDGFLDYEVLAQTLGVKEVMEYGYLQVVDQTVDVGVLDESRDIVGTKCVCHAYTLLACKAEVGDGGEMREYCNGLLEDKEKKFQHNINGR
ncbi:hypothetical protein BKA93DRAFT_747098 [Sparassis latifolia]